MNLDALADRLALEMELVDWRAASWLIVVPPDLEAAVHARVHDAMLRSGVGPEQILVLSLQRDAAGTAQLRDLNRERDLVNKEKRFIYLIAHAPEDVRFFHATAPDFSSTLDAIIEIEQPRPPGDWLRCAADVRMLMITRHATLDFTGVLPNTVERRELPLRGIYQALVEIEPKRTAGKVPGYLVLGDPGTGKTTYLRYLAWVYATGSDDPLGIGTKVPVLVTLSDYGEDRARNRVRPLLEFLPDWLEHQGIADARAVVSHLHDIVLLLDAIDELPSAETRRAVLNEVARLVVNEAVGAVVITGRSFLVDELPANLDPTLRIVSPRTPNTQQVRAFVDAFSRLRGRALSQSQDLIARIEGDIDLRVLARTPLVLAFMVILDELEGRLPDRRIEIYHRLGEMLVERWIRARSLGTSLPTDERAPTRADAMRVLGPLAWWLVERGGGSVDEDHLMAELVRIEAEHVDAHGAQRRASAMLELLRSDTALLVPSPGRSWRFVHASIGEYFAGIEATRNTDRWTTLLDQPFRPQWREVILFAAGQLGVIEGRTEKLDALVNAIVTKSQRRDRHYDATYPSLIAGLLDESPSLSRQHVDALVARLVMFLFDTAFDHGAAPMAQHAIVRALRSARGIVEKSLGRALRDRLARPAEIRWDCVFSAQWVLDFRLVKLGIAIHPEFGPFFAVLADATFREKYILDLEPLRLHFGAQSPGVFHIALWWLDASPEQRARPPQQILDQLPD